METYPFIGLDLYKFQFAPSMLLLRLVFFNSCIAEGYWGKKEHRRKFLDDFAERRGFNPKQAKNWYSIKSADITEAKVIRLKYEIMLTGNREDTE